MMFGTNFPLSDFPPAQPDVLACTASFAAPGIQLRLATQADLPFLRHLYGTLREQELAQIPWPDAARSAFLDSQFALQHRHFTTAYAAADFHIVQAGDTPIGRYYLLRQPPCYQLIDIALLPAWRGQGIGTALIAWSKTLAELDAAVSGIDLHVDERNIGAQRLYTQLGFCIKAAQSPYMAMHWPCPQPFN